MSALGPGSSNAARESRFAPAEGAKGAARRQANAHRSFDCAFEEALQRLQAPPSAGREGRVDCPGAHPQNAEQLQAALEYRARHPLNAYIFRSHSAEQRDPRLPFNARKRLAYCDFDSFLFNTIALHEQSPRPNEDLGGLFSPQLTSLRGLQALFAPPAEKKGESASERRRSHYIVAPQRPPRPAKNEGPRTRFSRIVAPGGKPDMLR